MGELTNTLPGSYHSAQNTIAPVGGSYDCVTSATGTMASTNWASLASMIRRSFGVEDKCKSHEIHCLTRRSQLRYYGELQPWQGRLCKLGSMYGMVGLGVIRLTKRLVNDLV